MKNKIIFISAIILVVIIISSSTLFTNSTALSAKEFQEKISCPDVQLVDIRNAEAYAEGHLANAVNIDYGTKFFMESMESLNKEQPLYLYCKSGVRTSEAAPILEGAGFKEVYYLKGGINAWKEQGFKIVIMERATVSK